MSRSASRRLDLNAARKARAEKGKGKKDPIAVELGDRSFTLPASLPASVPYGLALMARGETEGFILAVEALFGDRVHEALAAGLEVEDLYEIAREYAGGDDDEGESSASGS